MNLDAEIINYTAGLFLRYFRNGRGVDSDARRLSLRQDGEILKGHWAISEPVQLLIEHLLAHPYQARSLLESKERVCDAVARGRIDARRTWLYRRQSGLHSALITQEPARKFDTGPNLLLAWVLREAAFYAEQFQKWQDTSSPYLPTIEKTRMSFRRVQKISALRESLATVPLRRRPSPISLRDASRSRLKLYRLAFDAYRMLQDLENWNEDAVNYLIRSALLGPLEDWRRFELAVGLGVGEALARATGDHLKINVFGMNRAAPIVKVGRFEIYWQQITAYHRSADREPSEQRTVAALEAYGVGIGTERPDLLVVDQALDKVVAIVEVKYLAGDTAKVRFREAVTQVVRYARNYVPVGAIEPLLAQSLVALSHEAPKRIDSSIASPFSVDFEKLSQFGLDDWASALAGG